jgi:hypothetical protein
MLSGAFVAFVIEADNVSEEAVAHRTTLTGSGGERGAVWMASLAMWFNCLGPLREAGELTAAELERTSRMATNLDGMRRWGYVTIDGIGRARRGSGFAAATQAHVGARAYCPWRGDRGGVAQAPGRDRDPLA